jgi:hypothetical protein
MNLKRYFQHEPHMALHFSPVATPLRNLEIWHANNSGYAFAISRERKTGPEPHGKRGYVASWRPLRHDEPTVTVGGSPFATFAEAEEACELLRMHLLTAQGDMTMPIEESLTYKAMPAWTRIWHQWWVAVPRRSTAGRLVRGQVLRRHDGRGWIYRKLEQAHASNE